MDVAIAIESLVPGAQYTGSLTDNTQEAFDALVWTDEREKPTWEALTGDQDNAQTAATAAENKSAACALLVKSDMTAMRCFKAGVPFPADWMSAVVALRAVVGSGTLPSGGMPVLPAEYPAGS